MISPRWWLPPISRTFALANLNMAYAAISGTTKHVCLSPTNAAHVDDIIELMNLIAGGEKKRRERPFCSAGACCVVSPLAYEDESSEVCLAATRIGGPVWAVMAPQAGATAPAALAGTLVQVTAESLAALLLVQLVVPRTAHGFRALAFRVGFAHRRLLRRRRRAGSPRGGRRPDWSLLRPSHLGRCRYVRCEVARCPGRLRKGSHRLRLPPWPVARFRKSRA